MNGTLADLKQDERRGSATLPVQLRDPVLPVPQAEPEHVTVESERAVQIPDLHRHRADTRELKRLGHAGPVSPVS